MLVAEIIHSKFPNFNLPPTFVPVTKDSQNNRAGRRLALPSNENLARREKKENGQLSIIYLYVSRSEIFHGGGHLEGGGGGRHSIVCNKYKRVQRHSYVHGRQRAGSAVAKQVLVAPSTANRHARRRLYATALGKKPPSSPSSPLKDHRKSGLSLTGR